MIDKKSQPSWSRAHPNVSDACAFQIQCNADAAWLISNDGTDWGARSNYNDGVGATYVQSARNATSSFIS